MASSLAQPLRRQLILVIALLVAPTIAAAIWLAVDEFRETTDELRERTNATAVQTAAAIQRELTGMDRMVANLSANAVLQDMDGLALAPLIRPQVAQRSSVLDIVVFDVEGRIVTRSPSAESPLSPDPEVVSAVVTQGTRVVAPLKIAEDHTTYVAIGYPVRDDDGQLVGVLACYIDPQRLERVFGDTPLPPQSVVAVLEVNGRVLARNIDPERYVGQVLDADFTDGPEAPQQIMSVDGIERMFGQAMVERGPWMVSVGIPMSVAMDRALSMWLRTVPVLILTLGGWLVIAVVFSRRLTRSVGHLESAAQRIAAGDFSPIEQREMPTREFAELQRAFDEMLLRFNETRAALDTQMAEERRMRQEVESLQRQVIRQERLAAVGQLVSGVAHEINNPLQAILGFAELLQMQRDVPDTVKNDLVLIQKESARACAIIRNLAMFARQQTGEAEPVHLGDVIRSVAELRQRRLESEGIELLIENRSASQVAAVMTELQQVVLNFVVNAEQAIVMSSRQPGRITVRTYDRDDRVILEVEDTGPGVPPDHEARLFQPFFTTKPVGQGTGLGLSVSYGIIDSLGGHIGYRNSPSGGAVFFFDLPAAKRGA
jgi:C4-dicarboxylate-specific signal transduction histidine kinase